MVYGIKSSSNPCEICLAPDTELNAWVQGDQLVNYDRRYEKDQQRILEGIRGNPKAQGQHSTAAVASPLWGFMYGREMFGSSTQCFPVEVMHVKDLGVFPDIIALIKPFLSLSLSDRQCAAVLGVRGGLDEGLRPTRKTCEGMLQSYVCGGSLKYLLSSVTLDERIFQSNRVSTFLATTTCHVNLSCRHDSCHVSQITDTTLSHQSNH
jgi:hypothetical protein